MQVNPHQMEGFNFLISNLVAENPRGGILVHAPGSWKTFMIISFMQSFLAMSSQARPLVKKEFLIRQVEDTLLYDFYFVKADRRPPQLKVLKQWSTSSSPELFVVMELPSSACHMSPCSREKPPM
ncbi:hypothetical protein PVL29_013386 [Vitis rotundifolia]|uniref:Uncharacterized protein n=1 Tax=Vitis rotundifolia TaxID=103349 RepID=A0AA38ZLA6_VITRO|nr:hypothetical protein PVL29_013386 [Vitis rotundifolia]